MKKFPIVILHGWGLSGERFAKLAQALEKLGYQVFNPDLPGFGKTKLPDRPLVLKDYAEFLHDYLKKNKIDKPILIGHSFGGRLSLKYQQLYPKSVRALILSGTPGFTPIAKTKLWLFIALAKFGKLIFSLPIINKLQDDVRKWYYYFVGAKEFFRAQGAMRQTFKNIVKEDLVSSMRDVNVPCLLVWGENDIIVPTNIAYKMEKFIKNAHLIIIPDVDHGVPFKNPDIFIKMIKDFLTTLSFPRRRESMS